MLPPSAGASHGVVWPSSLALSIERRLMGSPPRCSPLPVSELGVARPDRPSPGPVRVQVHPRLARLPFRVPSSSLRTGSLSATGTTARVSALLTTSLPRVHFCEGFQGLASFRPQVVSTSRRFPPRVSSGACFIPEPCPGLVPFRGFSPRAADLSRREILPPCRWLTRRSPTIFGVRTQRASTSRRCSTRGRVPSRRC